MIPKEINHSNVVNIVCSDSKSMALTAEGRVMVAGTDLLGRKNTSEWTAKISNRRFHFPKELATSSEDANQGATEIACGDYALLFISSEGILNVLGGGCNNRLGKKTDQSLEKMRAPLDGVNRLML